MLSVIACPSRAKQANGLGIPQDAKNVDIRVGDRGLRPHILVAGSTSYNIPC